MACLRGWKEQREKRGGAKQEVEGVSVQAGVERGESSGQEVAQGNTDTTLSSGLPPKYRE